MTAQLGMMIYNCISAGEIVLALICISTRAVWEAEKDSFCSIVCGSDIACADRPGNGQGHFPSPPHLFFCCLHGDGEEREKDTGYLSDGSGAWFPDGDRIRILCGAVYTDRRISVRRQMAVCGGCCILDCYCGHLLETEPDRASTSSG